MKKLPDIAKQVARDIFNTFLQLQLMNPLKNLLFGTNLPTGGGGGLGGFLGSLFGGGGFGGTAASSWLAANPGSFTGLWRNGGISSTPLMRYARNGLLTKPTKMMSSMGPVIGGEAGSEAILPLSKSSSGRLGVDARGMGQGDAFSFAFAPVYNVQGNSEDIQALRMDMRRQEMEFESKTIAVIRNAQKSRKL